MSIGYSLAQWAQQRQKSKIPNSMGGEPNLKPLTQTQPKAVLFLLSNLLPLQSVGRGGGLDQN
jgi:hypothetical protein